MPCVITVGVRGASDISKATKQRGTAISQHPLTNGQLLLLPHFLSFSTPNPRRSHVMHALLSWASQLEKGKRAIY